MSIDPILDANQINDLRSIDAGRGAVLRRLVGKFDAVIVERVGLLRMHAEAANMAELAIAAHSLKGASGNLGAQRLAALCFQIEQAAKDNASSLARELIQSLSEEGEIARVALLHEAGEEA